MAEFRINVVVDPSGAQRGSRAVDRSLTRTEGRARQLGAAFSRAFAFIGLGVGLGSALTLLSGFSQEMSTVQAVTQATGVEFEDLRQRALELGTTTRFSATSAAEGMTFLARAGFDANEVLGAIGGTLTLAQAGGLGLGEAADIASNALTAFRLETDQTGRVVDVLALSANSANTNVSQLGQALSLVAPVSAGLNVSLEETVSAIGSLSDAGLQATVAGTGLRRILSTLESPASNIQEILESLGVTTDEVRISQVGLTAALTRLRDAGVDTGLALQIFGDRGGPAFEVLQNALPNVIAMTEALESADGTAQRIAETMDDNLNGALLSVQSAFEGLVLSIGEAGAQSALRSFLGSLAVGLRSAAENVDVLISGAESLAVALGISLAQRAIPAAIAGVRALTIAIASNPIGAIATAFTTGIALLVGFRDELRLASDSTATLGDVFAAFFDIVKEGFAVFLDLVQPITDQLGLAFREAFGDVDFSIRGVLRITGVVVDRTLGIFLGLADAIPVAFDALPSALGDIFIQAFNGVIDVVEGVLDIVVSVGITISTTLGRIVRTLADSFIALGRAGAAALRGDIAEAAEFAEQATLGLGRNLVGVAGQIPETFVRTLVDQADSDVIPRLTNTFEGAAENLGDATMRAFAAGFDVTVGQQLVEEVLTRAEARAAQRERDAAAAAAAAQQEEERQRQAREREARALITAPSPAESTAARGGGLAEVLEELEEEARLLRLTAQEREIANEVLRIERDLRDQNISLTGEERAGLEERLRGIQALSDQARALEDIRGPQEDLERSQAALNALLAEGAISASEFARAMLELEAASGRTSTTLSGGLRAGLAEAQLQLTDVSGLAQQSVVSAFGDAEDAIVSFVRTGQADFASLIDSILDDLARLALRQALAGLFGGGGGAGGLLGSIFGGFRQEGGPVQGNRAFLVGEQGPELFTPPGAGTITPAGETASLLGPQPGAPVVNVAPPEVSVRVVNVTDPDEIPSGIESPDGEQAILNVVRRNRRTVRDLLA